jgi:hypothetical protein
MASVAPKKNTVTALAQERQVLGKKETKRDKPHYHCCAPLCKGVERADDTPVSDFTANPASKNAPWDIVLDLDYESQTDAKLVG